MQPMQTERPDHILLVDDDTALCEMLSEYLHGEGFTVDTLHDGQSALNQLNDGATYDLAVLDIMMPGISGLDVLQSIRARMPLPVIMLTGRADDIDRILGLEMGADDYLAKPCNPRELAARIRATLRRSNLAVNAFQQTLKGSDDDNRNLPVELSAHGIELNLAQRKTTINSVDVSLTSAEFNTLALLMQHQGKVVSKETLTEKVLHRKLSPYDRSIDVHVSRIRQKLAKHLGDNTLINTLRGTGYQFSGETP
ncbi:Transcriptional regulatory protein CpxR [BD1-7 clade bacterium]|uniref:Transcriptional regulatory protein CpxR n=1 Tax=BD1-7 clade bacterium TaxID=2029982 RepID=A0A5S9PSM8_9GAMM|nr:Transcriptional regulatory protein CpxR [BD1-7 clade bacterium]